MIRFLLVFFLLYGGAHLYTFFKARAALSFGWKGGTALALFMALMVAAPVLVRTTERGGLEGTARFLALFGYSWMGLLFLFISASLALDLVRLLLFVTGLVLRQEVPLSRLSPPSIFAFLMILSLLLWGYGYFEARTVRIERIKVATEKLPPSAGVIRVVQISDVHLGLIVRRERLERILTAVRQERPDLLVVTGDLVDGQINRLDGLSAQFHDIRPTFGSFAVTGNHEFYAGLDESLRFIRRAGLTVLRGAAVTVEGLITVAGVDDRTARRFGGDDQAEHLEAALAESLPRDTFNVLLKHRPLVDEATAGLVDLQLSGHTHKGQIFPFGFFTWMSVPVHSGTVRLPGGCLLHVSRGSGTWGPPIRLLSPPEVTVIEIEGRERGG